MQTDRLHGTFCRASHAAWQAAWDILPRVPCSLTGCMGHFAAQQLANTLAVAGLPWTLFLCCGCSWPTLA